MKNQEDIKKKVAENIRFYRKKANLTQKQLAEKLGVKNTAVSNWENGQNSIDTELLFRVCDVFGITINQMYGIEEAESVIISSSDIALSDHEKDVIFSYRNHPEMQGAVDRLLGVEREGADIAKDMSKTVRAGASAKKPTGAK